MVDYGCVKHRYSWIACPIISREPIRSRLRNSQGLWSVARIPNHIPNRGSCIQNHRIWIAYSGLNIHQYIHRLVYGATAQVNRWNSVICKWNSIEAIARGIHTTESWHLIMRVTPWITINKLVENCRVSGNKSNSDRVDTVPVCISDCGAVGLPTIEIARQMNSFTCVYWLSRKIHLESDIHGIDHNRIRSLTTVCVRGNYPIRGSLRRVYISNCRIR